ncbi:MAG: sulfite exporter TauE/SafE family protein [Candidatus Eisenbacteria bacterium]|nr:sulfite exporter TauE/SafE family protein [Candidatus Eisenbacteria bacterium]
MSLDLMLAACGIAITHTVLGPDHYLPFIMLARARRWSRARTVLITILCGIGHVGSSIVLGLVGVLAGATLGWVQKLEGARGDWAAWALVWFGLAYMLWGLRTAFRARRGIDPHAHGADVHMHHGGHHHHHHEIPVEPGKSSTFWALFVVFVLGPCEPLIPLFVLPASRGRWELAGTTGLVFGLITVVAMVGLVLAGQAGMERLRLGRMERWAHAMAGGVVAMSGLAVIYLGL